MKIKIAHLVLTCLIGTSLLLASCGPGIPEEEAPTETATEKEPVSGAEVTSGRDYRQDMRDFVQRVSAYAKGIRPDFVVIPQNGHTLLTENGEETGPPALAYLNAIDGIGREDLFYGYDADNRATPPSERDAMISFMDVAESGGVEVLVTDYCSTETLMADSYSQNSTRGYVSFAAEHRQLDNIPAFPPMPFNMNSADVASLAEVRNFLYLIDSGPYSSKAALLNAIGDTDYDAVILDAFHENVSLTTDDIALLKTKANGGNRLIIAYMSIGEAEDYRYYWQNKWDSSPPAWLAEENPNWTGNYKVRYWDPVWQRIIYGEGNSYLRKILDAGFDGVYLDIIDAFEYFEDQ